MFPNMMEMLDNAFRLVASLDEPEHLNFVKKHCKELEEFGEVAKARIFGPTWKIESWIRLLRDSFWTMKCMRDSGKIICTLQKR